MERRKLSVSRALWEGFCDILRFFFVGETGKFSYTAAFAGYGLYVIHLTVESWKTTGTLDAVWAEWTVWVIPFLLGLRPAQKILSGGSPIGSFVSRFIQKEEKELKVDKSGSDKSQPDKSPESKPKPDKPQPASPMNYKEKFVSDLYPFAKAHDKKTGLNYLFIITQGANESGWGKSGIGHNKNNIFGIKAGKSWTGEKVLCLTTEYHDKDNVKYPEVISVVWDAGVGKYKYRVRDYFRSYQTFQQALDDHTAILMQKHFMHAWPYRDNPREYIKHLQSGEKKYATSTKYVSTILRWMTEVEGIIKKLNL